MYAKLLIKLTCKADNHVWTVGYRSYMETKTSIQKRVKSINNVRHRRRHMLRIRTFFPRSAEP